MSSCIVLHGEMDMQWRFYKYACRLHAQNIVVANTNCNYKCKPIHLTCKSSITFVTDGVSNPYSVFYWPEMCTH